MRMANVKDVWRTAIKNNRGIFTLEKLSMTNVRGIGNAEILFPTKLTALCGENGVGKTTILKSLFSALVPKKAERFGIVLKPQDAGREVKAWCEIKVRVAQANGARGPAEHQSISDPAEVYRFLADDSEDALVTYLDGAATVQRLIVRIHEDADFSTALEGMPQRADAEETLQLRREITGRAYSGVTTIEVDDYADLPAFPYFRVTSGGATYSSEEMGLGEFCANYLIWALDRLKVDSVLLLEEPESHLPPRAQVRLMAHVAKISVEKSLSVVVSTHSQHTLENIPLSHITFMGRLVDKSVIKRSPKMATLYESLRIAKLNLCVLVLEDHSAFAFAETLLKEVAPDLLDRLDFTWRSGWGDIDKILETMPRHGPGRVGILGVYDGDQREAERKKVSWPYIFLPGKLDPAEYMAAITRQKSIEFAAMLLYDSDGMAIAIGNLDGVDVKDFFPELAKSIGKNIQSLYQAATELWLSEASNAEQALEFCDSIRKNVFT